MRDDGKPLVSLLYPELQEQAAAALGRAFIDDPMVWALMPQIVDMRRRAGLLCDMFQAMFAVERKTGQPAFGVICHAKVVAAAVTEGAGRPSAFDTTLAGVGQTPRLLRALGPKGLQRALSLFRVLSNNHPSEPHLYLQALGVDPDYQKRHLGGLLLDHLREQAQAHPDVTGRLPRNLQASQVLRRQGLPGYRRDLSAGRQNLEDVPARPRLIAPLRRCSLGSNFR